MYQLNFTLKQHTPIIHFQHDQHGATLRATEVKPKLDRFILEKLGKESDEYDINEDYETTYKRGKDIAEAKGWLIDKDKGALDYKMRIEPNKEDRINIQSNHSNSPMYFGNQNNNSNPKHLKIKEFTNCSIYTPSIDLLNNLKLIIDEFFKTNNFGTRQNKGYGSFIVVKDDEIHEFTFTKNTFYFSFKINQDSTYKEVLSVIDYFYKLLKSGVNYTKFKVSNHRQPPEFKCDKARYKKSLFYLYLDEKFNYTWEKRWIKEKYFSLTPKTPPINPKYARALLGLATQSTFTSCYCDCTNDEAISLDNNVKIFSANNELGIERIKSPFIFKPIIDGKDVAVYILVDDMHINEIYKKGKSYNKFFVFNKKEKVELSNKKFKLGEVGKINKYKEELSNKSNRSNHENSDLIKLNEFIGNSHELELPETKISIADFLDWVKQNKAVFMPKDFGWRAIGEVNSIELKKITSND